MHVSRIRLLCIAIFKTLNKLNPFFQQDIYIVKSSNDLLREAKNLQHYRPNQVTFGSNGLRSLGPQIWNGLPNDMKSAENMNIFETTLEKWESHRCKCNICKYVYRS